MASDITKVFLQVLQRGFKADKHAFNQLMNCRAECNETLVEDPAITVLTVGKKDEKKTYYVGILGILNGILTEMKQAKIAMVLDEKENLLGFKEFRGK